MDLLSSFRACFQSTATPSTMSNIDAPEKAAPEKDNGAQKDERTQDKLFAPKNSIYERWPGLSIQEIDKEINICYDAVEERREWFDSDGNTPAPL